MIFARIKLWVIIGSLIIGCGYGWGQWNRFDAERDLRAKLAAEENARRLADIEEDRERDAEIDNLDPDGLRERAGEWMLDSPR